MATLVVDASGAIRLAEAGYAPAADDALLAPTLLRSQTLAALRADVAAGRRDDAGARALLAAVDSLPVRLLGDRVLRRTAWRVAAELGMPDTYAAEYLALTRLHGDALVTAEPGAYPDAGVRILAVEELLG